MGATTGMFPYVSLSQFVADIVLDLPVENGDGDLA